MQGRCLPLEPAVGGRREVEVLEVLLLGLQLERRLVDARLRDIAEIVERCRGDIAEMQGRCLVDARLRELLVGGEDRVEGGGMRGDEGLRLRLEGRYGGD